MIVGGKFLIINNIPETTHGGFDIMERLNGRLVGGYVPKMAGHWQSFDYKNNKKYSLNFVI